MRSKKYGNGAPKTFHKWRVNEFRRANIMADVSARYLRHETFEQIAKAHGASVSLIGKVIGELEAEWRAKAVRDWDTLKTTEVARIDLVEKEAWAAWYRSCGNFEGITQTTEDRPVTIRDDQYSSHVETVAVTSRKIRIERRAGDARYLAIIMQCIERRCAILGLDAPKVVDIEMRIRDACRREGLDEEAVLEDARSMLKEYAIVAKN